jgi:isoamylase
MLDMAQHLSTLGRDEQDSRRNLREAHTGRPWTWARDDGPRPVFQGLSLNELLRRGEIEVHGVRLQQPDLSSESHSLAMMVRNVGAAIMIHTMFNAYWEPLIFELPRLSHQLWRRWIDTSRDAPDDVSEWSLAAPVPGPTCAVQPARS